MYSTLASPSSAIVRGPSFSRSQPNLWIFLPLQNRLPVKKHLAWVLCSSNMHDRLAAAIEAPFTCILLTLLSCARRNTTTGLPVRMISRHHYSHRNSHRLLSGYPRGEINTTTEIFTNFLDRTLIAVLSVISGFHI